MPARSPSDPKRAVKSGTKLLGSVKKYGKKAVAASKSKPASKSSAPKTSPRPKAKPAAKKKWYEGRAPTAGISKKARAARRSMK